MDRKLFLFFTASFMLLGPMLFASGQQGTEESEKQVAPGPFGKYDTPITVTAVKSVDDTHKYYQGEDLENNAWSRAYVDELGINLKYDWTVNGTQWDQKMNLAIASGSLPDIFPVGAKQLAMLVEAELIQPLGAIYDEYASDDLKEIQLQQGTIPFDAATFNGQLMGIPETNSFIDAANFLWIREDWRNALNLSKPETMDELIKIIYAFANDDPDGNGKDDTYGFAVSNNIYNYGYSSIEGFCNAFHAYPTIWVKDSSGKLVYGSIQPEMKEALIVLQKMFKDGVIDPEFGVKDRGKLVEDTVAGKYGVGIGAQWNPFWPYIQARENFPNLQVAAYEIPSADNKPSLAQIPSSIGKFLVVRKDFLYPEAAVKLTNIFVQHQFIDNPLREEFLEDSEKGIAPHKWPIFTTWPAFRVLDRHKGWMAVQNGESSEGFNSEQLDTIDRMNSYLDGTDDAQWGEWSTYKSDGPVAINLKRVERDGFMSNKFFGAPTETMVTKGSTLEKMEEEMFIRFIMGDTEAFDKFVADWKVLGGDSITEEVNLWANS
ncbi:MAG: hypothetical protein B6241_12700 [Spirochaetaceae bacterium 4572_59]|nr:MAG: hypothetical protein B6241_12700 [Spirochaetaceae bacterium 4572_59]